ncbi:MAG TPA: hypothetical protein HPP83_13340 [Candidatus Hydrogenedentes bacterium]|nr:hypothetical protein [Candidatus Hydrogenedentota bacterium]
MSEIRKREDELRTSAAEKACNSIKRTVVIAEIGKAEGVEVTEADFEKEVVAISERTGAKLDMINEYLAEDQRRDAYEERIFRAKTMAVIMSHAKVQDKKLDPDQFEAEEQNEET